MRRFDAKELRRFFTAVDENLTKDAAIIVIGGSAIALYGAAVGTVDVDTYETDLAPLEEAIARARVVTGFDIPVSRVGVADAPYNYRDRLQREPGGWTRLTVWKLERHDLALSKAVRGYENDLNAIEKLHQVSPLDLGTLVGRWIGEMGHTIGERGRLDQNFVAMIERLYGQGEADRVETRLRGASG